jgi:FkbM family methyltransferase
LAKTVHIYERPFTVTGGESDDYYRSIFDGCDATDTVMTAILPHVAHDAVCIDVGANIGLYSLGLSTLAPEGRIFAFEPSPAAFSHLQANLAANRVVNVEAFPLAVTDSTGTVVFHDFSFYSAGSFAADERSLLTAEFFGSEVLEAATTTLDDFVFGRDLERIDLVKIDVEGAELAVLAGAEKTLATFRPTVVMEFNTFGFTIHQGVLPQTALARIRELFPHVFVMDRTDGALTRLETPYEMYRFLYDNGIHGPTDNLLCTFSDLDVTRRYGPTASPPANERPVELEAEAMRRTVSWRVTAPLRAVRRGLDPVLGRIRAVRGRMGD